MSVCRLHFLYHSAAMHPPKPWNGGQDFNLDGLNAKAGLSRSKCPCPDMDHVPLFASGQAEQCI